MGNGLYLSDQLGAFASCPVGSVARLHQQWHKPPDFDHFGKNLVAFSFLGSQHDFYNARTSRHSTDDSDLLA
jgi:hypothetical protein